MPKKQVIITGDKALNRKLSRLRGTEAKKVIRKAARPALKPVRAEAMATAPVESGELKRSIKVRALSRSRTRFGYRVTTGKSFFSGKTFYGGFIEWGTKYIAARGFVKRAAIAKREEALRIYRSKIKEEILGLARKP